MSVRPKKHLGQHFLADPNIIRKIADSVEARSGERVIEIGPGEGALTEALLARYPDLIALEVDDEAADYLAAQFPNLDLRRQDVLEADWSVLAAEAEGPLVVVGNLPYYITSPILFSLLKAREHVRRAVVMMQKEVAERMAAAHGNKTYGTLSVYFQLSARVETLFSVSRHVFRPKPSVESAVVALDFDAAPVPDVDWTALQQVVKAAFGKRRKMLRNSLGPLVAAADVELPADLGRRRPEALPPEAFVDLARLLHP